MKVKKRGGALNRESGDTETVRFSIKKKPFAINDILRFTKEKF